MKISLFELLNEIYNFSLVFQKGQEISFSIKVFFNFFYFIFKQIYENQKDKEKYKNIPSKMKNLFIQFFPEKLETLSFKIIQNQR